MVKEDRSREGENERNRFKIEVHSKQEISRKHLNKEEFVKRETAINEKRMKQKRKAQKVEVAQIKSSGIRWIVGNEENDKTHTEEERINVYEWVGGMNEELGRHVDIKVITLFDKWKYIINDHPDDGTKCRNLIQGKAIITAYEQRNYELMHRIAIKACNNESQKYFYKLTASFSAKRYIRSDIANLKKRLGLFKQKEYFGHL
jgi:hypothetical protein